MAKLPKHDIRIDAEGFATVWTFRAVTKKAKQFVEDHVRIEDWQRLGNGFAVDHRPARELAHRMADAGLIVLNPSYGFLKTN